MLILAVNPDVPKLGEVRYSKCVFINSFFESVLYIAIPPPFLSFDVIVIGRVSVP